ncbi:MAG: intermembrane phospholipid transport protein YdbH family protein, partial [Alphaproteobacteria bacterium]
MEHESSPDAPPAQPAPPLPPAPKRRLLKFLILSLAFFAISTATVLIFRHEIATTLALEVLRHNGFEDAELSVTKVTFHGISVQRVKLQPFLNAKQIDATFSLKGLSNGRLKTIIATGLHINLPESENGSDNDAFPIEQIPIGNLQIDDGTATFQTPNGPAKAQFSLRLSPTTQGVRPLRATLRAHLDDNDVSLNLNGVMGITPSQSIDLKASLTGRLRAGDLNAKFDGGVDALLLSFGRKWARLDLNTVEMESGAIKAQLSQTILQLNAAADGREFDLTGRIRLQNASDPEWPEITFALGGDLPKTK